MSSPSTGIVIANICYASLDTLVQVLNVVACVALLLARKTYIVPFALFLKNKQEIYKLLTLHGLIVTLLFMACCAVLRSITYLLSYTTSATWLSGFRNSNIGGAMNLVILAYLILMWFQIAVVWFKVTNQMKYIYPKLLYTVVLLIVVIAVLGGIAAYILNVVAAVVPSIAGTVDVIRTPISVALAAGFVILTIILVIVAVIVAKIVSKNPDNNHRNFMVYKLTLVIGVFIVSMILRISGFLLTFIKFSSDDLKLLVTYLQLWIVPDFLITQTLVIAMWPYQLVKKSTKQGKLGQILNQVIDVNASPHSTPRTDANSSTQNLSELQSTPAPLNSDSTPVTPETPKSGAESPTPEAEKTIM